MDSGMNNLEALVEDEDEEIDNEEEPEEAGVLQSSEESGNEDEDGNVTTKEANKFDILCDGVVGSMALVQTSVQELLAFKDELIKHALPPSVLIKLTTACGRVFRSVSDQSKPINELVRMVHVYSTPWEEKSAALKKLHDDYENKQRQLNIAIKRLQLVDAHSKRIAKEKRIMNWEKVFAKVTSNKGHGRRWKFLIETIKQKAKMGFEHVQEYTRSLEESSASESEDEDEDTMVAQQSSRDVDSMEASSLDTSQKQQSETAVETEVDESRGEVESVQSSEPEEPVVAETTVEQVEDLVESVQSVEEVESGTVSPKRVRFGSEQAPVIVKPPTTETAVWTGEPDYDVYLYVRIFQPQGLDSHDLKCSLTYDNQMFKTGVLDLQDEVVEDLPVSPTRPPAAGRHQADRSPLVEDPPPKNHGKYEEFTVSLDVDDMKSTKDGTSSKPKHIQFAIQHGQFEEIIAMATVDVTDLQQLGLQTVYLPAPRGDDVILRTDDDQDSIDSLSDSMDISINDAASEKSLAIKDEVLKNVDPIPFPLFSLKPGRGSTGPAGSLPVIFYWGKRPRPQYFNRQSGTLGLSDLVYDLTGIDLRTTTKEDLHKEARDRASSAIQFTPEPREETVLKCEFDAIQIKHEHEIETLQNKYETRLQELMDNLQSMVEQQKQQKVKSASPRPASVASNRSTGSVKSSRSVKSRSQPSRATPTVSSPVKPATPVEVAMAPVTPPVVKSVPSLPSKPKTVRALPLPTRVNKNFKVGKPLPKWGENLPQDFFERLKLFEEESKIRKQELNEKTLEEIKSSLEQKLAGQHKLSQREEAMYDALKDVSLPALFMPYKTGNVYNPRAHQYFHPTGSTDLRLTQPPSVFQLPPLKSGDKMSVLNLFDLSKNFNKPAESWLMDRYIQQQHPVQQPGFPRSSERTLSGFNRSTQNTPRTNQIVDSKCSNSIIERQPPDGARQDQEVEA
ncbi:uncharacterized protein LOC126809962 [Patella vulgata]|uniref:uncharacterized protein LOC126809962 n=1 Tax=Patella vulgata TaxID=6465 RepID=UPI0024A92F89|nr:uncharacterized protein LOC126809962 [Patella vulgata]